MPFVVTAYESFLPPRRFLIKRHNNILNLWKLWGCLPLFPDESEFLWILFITTYQRITFVFILNGSELNELFAVSTMPLFLQIIFRLI